MILAIDPGNERSAWVIYDETTGQPEDFGIGANADVLQFVEGCGYDNQASHLAVEMIASYGMPVGREVFETCVWIGRMVEAWDQGVARRQHEQGQEQSCGHWTLVYRRDVKLHLCGQPRAKDGNIRQALIDRYGGKDKAIGKKASPGALYGVSADVWSALAIAVTYSDNAPRPDAPRQKSTLPVGGGL